MAVRSLELAAVRISGAGTTTIYTCPDGKTALVKDVLLSASGVLTPSCSLHVVRGSVDLTILSTTSTAHDSGMFVALEPGDLLRLTVAGTTPVGSAWVSGAELLGVSV